jgi:hypothetical protein
MIPMNAAAIEMAAMMANPPISLVRSFMFFTS